MVGHFTAATVPVELLQDCKLEFSARMSWCL